jgi:hypothetical protein
MPLAVQFPLSIPRKRHAILMEQRSNSAELLPHHAEMAYIGRRPVGRFRIDQIRRLLPPPLSNWHSTLGDSLSSSTQWPR